MREGVLIIPAHSLCFLHRSRHLELEDKQSRLEQEYRKYIDMEGKEAGRGRESRVS